MLLTEMLFALSIGSIVLTAAMLLLYFTGRSFAGIANYADLDRYSRNALDRMSEEIRQTRYLTNFSSTSITFTDDDGLPLSFTYDPNARVLKRVKSGEERILLRECDSLYFEMFQRNPIPGQFSAYTATSVATCKLVQVTWRCSRTIVGAKLNTETVQSAKIVIRKRRT